MDAGVRRRVGRHYTNLADPRNNTILTDPGAAMRQALNAMVPVNQPRSLAVEGPTGAGAGAACGHDERWASAKNIVSRSDRSHGLRMLELDMVECDGGEYSPSYPPSNLLAQNPSVYCSCKSSDVTAIVQCRGEGLFVMTHAVLVAPPSGHYTAPVAEAIVFVSTERLSVADLARYDGFTRGRYDELLRRKAAAGESLDEGDPAAYLTVDEATRMVTAKLDIPRTGRYVGVKLLRATGNRRGGANGANNNIDVEYVGVKGFTGGKAWSEGTIR